MTAKTKSAPAIKPEAEYDVRLLKAVKLGRRTLSPMHRYTLKGAALSEIDAAAIKSADEIKAE